MTNQGSQYPDSSESITVSNPANWGDREMIAALGKRIQTMLPGGDKLTYSQAMAAAQYANLTDANLFRGEVWAYQDKDGKLVLVDGYKLLVRWAKNEMPYTETFFELSAEEKDAEGLDKGDTAYWCVILRQDQNDLFRSVLNACIAEGWPYSNAKKEAYSVAATVGIGVVTKKDTFDKNGRPMSPAKTLTWPDIARRRALKNALRRSHGSPSPRQLNQISYQVGETTTRLEDWFEGDQYSTVAERERHAQLNAWERERQKRDEGRTAEERQTKFAANVSVLRGPEEDYIDLSEDDYEVEPQKPTYPPPTIPRPRPQPKPETPKPSGAAVPDSPKDFLSYVNARVQIPFDNIVALHEAIKNNSGTDWSWPHKGDATGWREAANIALKVSQEKFKEGGVLNE